MRRSQQNALMPPGLSIKQVQFGENAIIAIARAQDLTGSCPTCGARSNRIHSRYGRGQSDLPATAAIRRAIQHSQASLRQL